MASKTTRKITKKLSQTLSFLFNILETNFHTSYSKNMRNLYLNMKTSEQILTKYSITRETAAQYIDAITRSNQTQTAEELQVSRDTINRYKNTFAEMNAQERLLLITTLTQENLLDQATKWYTNHTIIPERRPRQTYTRQRTQPRQPPTRQNRQNHPSTIRWRRHNNRR